MKDDEGGSLTAVLFLLFGVLGGSLKKQTALGDVTSDKCVSCKLSKGLPEKGMTGCRDCLQKADRRGYLKNAFCERSKLCQN